jgi:hypothetical protein
MRRFIFIAAITACSLALLTIGGASSATAYYAANHGSHCANCHEMANYVSAVHSSPHHNATCLDCHEASMATKLRHVRVHLSGRLPEAVRLRDVDMQPMMVDCQKCHQHEYASWHAGPHSATYTDIFASTAHNSKRRLMDDCLRCHGMYFNGAIRDLVQPQTMQGPWHVTRTDLANQSTIPCQACHWVHREGSAQIKPDGRFSMAGSAVQNSLAFFDRREEMHFVAAALAIPAIYDGARPLKVSPDPRQGICYQCHAPRSPEVNSIAATSKWGVQAGSGDDRSPMGVHEGLSCLSCHNGHSESARASCATCHPQMSHCGLAVEKMDTTFANPLSPHNIHWVKCIDCHQHGVPRVKAQTVTSVREFGTR